MELSFVIIRKFQIKWKTWFTNFTNVQFKENEWMIFDSANEIETFFQ